VTGSTLGGVSTSETYTRFGETLSYTASLSGTTVLALQYTRDKLARVTTKTETIGGITDTYEYTYDLGGRLTEVKKNGSTIATYTYDSNGNRLTRSDPNGTTSGTYDAQDRLLQYGDANYAYTANGELLTKTENGQVTTYTYDELGNLLSVVLPNGTRIDYVIDGANRRIGKKVGGTLVQGFLYRNELTPVAELGGAGNVIARFVYGTRTNVPDYMEKGGVRYRIIPDRLGSVRLVLDSSTGGVVQRMDYDEFGNVTLDTNPGFQPFGFAGGLSDRDTGLVRFGARDYDPVSGRWTVPEPSRFAGRGTNLYEYVGNDSINWIDPSGFFEYSPSAGDPVDDTTTAAMNCFETCSGHKVVVSGAKEAGHSAGGPHESGQACDVSKEKNPWLTRETAEKCFEKCFSKTSYAQEEGNHFHFQTRSGKGGATGFAKGVK
jgi:RHS repeat-associated protein